MSTNADSLVRDAIAAHRGGDKERARKLLLQAVERDERHEQAWLWLSAVVDTIEDQITCLENVLTINPNNAQAQRGIQLLNEKMAAKPAPTAPQTAASEDVFANVSFTQPEPARPKTSPLPPDDEESEELPSDMVWDTLPTSSASAAGPKAEPSPKDYGDWIAGLNIGANEAPETFGLVNANPAHTTVSPFVGAEDELFSEDTPFEIDRNIFGYDDDDDEPGKPVANRPSPADPFYEDDDDDDASGRLDIFTPQTARSAPVAQPAPKPAPEPLRSPSPTAVSRNVPLQNAVDEDDNFEDDDDFLEGDLIDQSNAEVDVDQLFGFIPAEIQATRLPGTNESYPALLIVGFLMLLVLNGGALALVFVTLSGG
jgi:hypothetical protein